MGGRFRVLITGGSGFVGRHLTRALALTLPDADVIAAGRRRAELSAAPARYVPLDVADAAQVRELLASERPTHLFHLAAISSVPACAADPRRTWAVNFTGTLNVALGVLEAAPECRLIYCGSAAAYGASSGSSSPLDESAPLDPTSHYAGSKAAADTMLGQMAHQGLKVVRLRPFNHTGPGQSEDFVVPSIAAQIARIESGQAPPLLRVGNLDAQRDFLDVADVVDAYLEVMRRFDQLPTGIALNIASGERRSVRSIVDDLIALSAAKLHVRSKAEQLRSGDPLIIWGNAHRARTLLEWSPRRSWQTTLNTVLEYWREQVSAAGPGLSDHAVEALRKRRSAPVARG